MNKTAGDPLTKLCPNYNHGRRRYLCAVNEFDPDCSTCIARDILSEHDHLHLGGEKCDTPGLNGVPGSFVKCKCGGYHH